jgi:hypothetical protein
MGKDYIWTKDSGFVACAAHVAGEVGGDCYEEMAQAGYSPGRFYGDGDLDGSFQVWGNLNGPHTRHPLPRQYPYCVWFNMPVGGGILTIWIPTDIDMLEFLRCYVPVAMSTLEAWQAPNESTRYAAPD